MATSFFASSRRQVLAEMKRIQNARVDARAKEPPLMFIEVDPAQVVTEPPKNAKYYSSRSTQAANPDAQADTDVPRIEGSQTHVPKTEDVPRTKQFPLQPSPPKDPAPPAEQPETKPTSSPTPGDLALARIPKLPDEPRETPDAPQVGRVRPHTIAEAQQMMGLKIKQDGGVTRTGWTPRSTRKAR